MWNEACPGEWSLGRAGHGMTLALVEHVVGRRSPHVDHFPTKTEVNKIKSPNNMRYEASSNTSSINRQAVHRNSAVTLGTGL